MSRSSWAANVIMYKDNIIFFYLQGAEAKYGIILKVFSFSLICSIFEKRGKSKFSWLALIFKHFFLNWYSTQYKWVKKKWQRISDLLNAENKPKFLCLSYTRQRKKFHGKKSSWSRRISEGLIRKGREGFLTALATVIKKEPTPPIRKCANELTFYEKSVRTAIKLDSSPDFIPLITLYEAL